MHIILTGGTPEYSDELKRRDAELRARALALEARTKRLVQARALELAVGSDMSAELMEAFRTLRADLLTVQRDDFLLRADALAEQIEAERKLPPGSFDGVVVPDGVPPGGLT